jgi:phospholipid/cholesterol/gamma-HCH transport system substrate-binding protein
VKRAIKAHFKDFIAITVLIVIALATLLIILSNQKAALPSWIPGLGQEFYSINAEFETAQAITPGQGQAAVIAGINVGKVGAAELNDGVARVRLDIEPKYKDLLHQDAEFLTRPKTGLNDMVVEIDPGTTGPPPEEGSTLPLSQGLSNIQLEEFWATLDRDTQDYLVLLLNGAGVGLDGKGRELMQGLRRFGPFTQYTARLNGLLEKRRENISGGVSALSKIAVELGNNDEVVADFITNSKNNLQAWADEEAALREALTELPPTLLAAQDGLTKSNRLSLVLRPTLLRLIPGAKNLKSSLISLQKLGRNVTPLIRDDIRPFTTEVRPVFEDLGRTSRASEVTTKKLKGVYLNLNRLLDLWAYNPPGDAQEGFLFWSPWLAHNVNSSATAQDAIGPVRRTISTINCNTGLQANQVGWNGFTGTPQLFTAYRLAQLPPPTNPVDGGICPTVPPAGP